MPCVSLTGIAEQCGLNPGGQKPYLLTIAKEDVESIPAAVEEVITTAIVPKTGKVFVKWDFDIDSGELKVKTDGEGTSLSISVEQNLYIPRNNPTVQSAIKKSLGRQLITVSVDSLGQKRLVGDTEKGAYLTFEGGTGLKGTDKAGRAVKLTLGGLDHEPYYITSTIPV